MKMKVLRDGTSSSGNPQYMRFSGFKCSRKLMTMSLLYPCGKPCSTGTHNEEEKKPALFSAIIHSMIYDGITNSKLNPKGAFSILQSNRRFYYIYTVKMVIHKARNLIDTIGIADFGLKRASFQSNTMSLC